MDSQPQWRTINVSGETGWLAKIEGKWVLVVNRNDTGYAVIGTDRDRVLEITERLPAPSRTIWERLVGASSSTVEFIGIIP